MDFPCSRCGLGWTGNRRAGLDAFGVPCKPEAQARGAGIGGSSRSFGFFRLSRRTNVARDTFAMRAHYNRTPIFAMRSFMSSQTSRFAGGFRSRYDG